MNRCIVCNSTNISFVREIKSTLFNEPTNSIKDLRKEKRGGYYKFYKCKDCKSNFFDVDNVNIDVLYNKSYKKFYSRNRINTLFFKSKVWLYQKEIIECILDRNLYSILDIGCRTGDFLLHFDKHVLKEGIEIDKYTSNIAKNRGINVINGDIENISITNKYDIVTAFAVIEHLKNPHKSLKKLSSLVNKGGVLVIMVPTRQCLKEKIMTNFIKKINNKEWHMYSPPAHINFISKNYLDNYLNKNGFLLKKRIYTTGGLFNLHFRYLNRLVFKFDCSVFNKIPIFDHMYSYYKKL